MQYTVLIPLKNGTRSIGVRVVKEGDKWQAYIGTTLMAEYSSTEEITLQALEELVNG